MPAETTNLEYPAFQNELTELALLVPSWQVVALEHVANREGLTLAQYLRRVLAKALPPSACWQ